ncbi:MAG TPA: DNA-directed RNA polymerase subunit omega [Nitrospiria bacterium]|jgi:DNA-directed RNA polymerase subunit omega|nr:DNA-directed RNA polymerase subunit omega [Nitrospiria bacterium]
MTDITSLPITIKGDTIDTRYRLVIIASQRTKQLMQGRKPMIETKAKKPTSIALDEVLSGKLEFFTGKEARQALKDARRLKEEEAKVKALMPRPSDIDELKKDLSVYVNDSKERVDLVEEEEV